MRHALILAGGSGTRLWPFSTRGVPKQLVPLFDGRSLLDIAVERAAAVAPTVWLATGAGLADAVAEVDGLAAEHVILEPSGRDTLPALTLAMTRIIAEDPEAVVAVLTADHLIEPLGAFSATIDRGFAVAEAHDDALVTFGVVPDHPATSFGYLELGDPLAGDALRVARFAEKPQLKRAEQLVEQGALWNSGMFVWQAAAFLAAVSAFAAQTLELVRDGSVEAWEQVPKVSVDYGVMEPASTSPDFVVAAIPLAARWLDVGSWPQYGDALGRGSDGNAIAARTVLVDAHENVVASTDPDHLVTLVGVEGLIVVHTPRATLVVPVDQAQRVKELHAQVVETEEDYA